MPDDYQPVSAFDVADENPAVIANHLRALQSEVRSGFELIATRLLTAIEQLNQKLGDFADWRDGVRRWQENTDKRLDALEAKPQRGKKKR